MPFVTVETVNRANRPAVAKISYMPPKRHKNNRNKDDDKPRKPRLLITLPTTVCGGAKSSKFKLVVGTGDHRGLARIVGDDVGSPYAVKPVEFKSHFMFRFGYVPLFGDDCFDGDEMPLRRISEDIFEFDLPKHLVLVDESSEGSAA